MTRSGGWRDFGTLFQIKNNGTDYRLVRGLYPDYSLEPALLNAALTLGPDNFIYGTSASGGPRSFGSVFRIRPDGSSSAWRRVR